MHSTAEAAIHTVHTSEPGAAAAGMIIASSLHDALGGNPDAVIVYASSRYDHTVLLRAIMDGCNPTHLVGSSSAGEFIRSSFDEGSACAIGFRSRDLRFAVGVGRGIAASTGEAAAAIARSFKTAEPDFPYRAALVMADALAGHGAELVEALTLATAGRHQFFGGGAGDDAHFQRTVVFAGDEVLQDAAVALEIRSRNPIGIGAAHGWDPVGPLLRVTAAQGTRLISLNGRPAVDAYLEHAERAGRPFDREQPLPFFLHCVLGIRAATGWRLRVPLGIAPDGALLCAAEVPVGSVVSVMEPRRLSAAEAAREAVSRLEGRPVRAALFFDCVATRLRLGKVFAAERQSVESLLGDTPCIGCNTYGQIVRHPGQYTGFHNCTAVVCALA